MAVVPEMDRLLPRSLYLLRQRDESEGLRLGEGVSLRPAGPLARTGAGVRGALFTREGLKTPTGVEPAAGTLWFTERAVGEAESMPVPNR